MALTDVVEALRRRLDWHETSPATVPIMGDDLLGWAAEILLELGPPQGRLDPEADDEDVLALQVAACLHLYRSQAQSADAGEQDLSAAFALLTLLLPHHGHVLPDDLREDVDAIEWEVPDDGATAWAEAGVVHLRVAESRADTVVLDHGIALFRQVGQTAAADHPVRLLVDLNLSHALRLRAERTRDFTEARAAVSRARAALAQQPIGEARALSWLNLVAAYLAAVKLGDSGEMDAMVAAAGQAAGVLADDPRSRPQALFNLGAALRMRWLDRGVADDLREAYQAAREASTLMAAQPSSPWRVKADANLAMVLLDLHDRESRPDYLNDAIARLSRAKDELAPDDPDRIGFAEGLVRARLGRLDASGEGADRDAAMTELTDAIRQPGADATKTAVMRGLLGRLHHDRWVDQGDFADLTAALDLLTRSRAEVPADHAFQTSVKIGLAACLRDRSEHIPVMADLDWALELLADVCDRDDAPPDAVQLRAMVSAERANLRGDTEALRESAQVFRAALDRGDGDRRRLLSALSYVLNFAARHSGAPEDVEAAIESARLAVAEAGSGLDRAMSLANLSAPLLARFQNNGGLADLNEAITALERAVTAAPAGHRIRHRLLSSLGFGLMTRYHRTGDQRDLTGSVACHRQALLHTGPAEMNGESQVRLVGALVQSFVDLDDRQALLEAVDHSRAAVAAAVPRSQHHCIAVSWLARALSQLAMADGDPAAGDEAVALIRHAVDIAEGPFRSGMRMILARLLWQRLQVPSDPGWQLDAVVAAYRTVVEDTSALPMVRFDAAGEWAVIADGAGLSGLALEGFCHVARLLPEAAWYGVHRSDQLRVIAANRGLAGAAVRAAVAESRGALAVELAESTRNVLAGQALQLRRDLGDLRTRAPELAARMAELSALLDDTGLSPLDDGQAGRPLGQRIRAARDWQQLAAEAAALLGQDTSARSGPPAYMEIAAALTAPVVYVNVTSTSCAALLIRPGSTEPEVVDLPGLRERDIDAAVDGLRAAAPGRAGRDIVRVGHVRRTLTGTLAWLWETVTGPVLAAIGATAPVPGGAAWPRLAWCLSGALARLPVHAAQPQHGDGALDRVISSYTTSLSALLRPHPAGRPHTLLVVSAPDAPGLPQLPAAADEARALSRLVKHTRVLAGPGAGPSGVLAAIPAHTCVHFACHAGWTGDGPTGTPRLALTTGDITPLDLAGLRLDDAELAYLSACDTTVGLADAADEGLHIAGAVQLAGFRQVISTLWTIQDDVAAAFAQDVYRRMTGSGGDLEPVRAPEALHHAVRALRDRAAGAPEQWAPYLHLGGFAA